MKRRTKWILIAGVAAVVLPALAMTVLVVAGFMAFSGTWPFEELDRRTRYIELSGGRIRIEGVEIGAGAATATSGPQVSNSTVPRTSSG